MKAKDLREKTSEELVQEIAQLKEQLFKLRFQHVTNQLENTAQLKSTRRDLARVETIIRERELAANKE